MPMAMSGLSGSTVNCGRYRGLCDREWRVRLIVLLSDFDRATKAQVETLRLILDSISGRVMSPDGRAVPVIGNPDHRYGELTGS